MKYIPLAILLLTMHACSSKGREVPQLRYSENQKKIFIQKIFVNNTLITAQYLPKEVEKMLDKKKGYQDNDYYDDFIHFRININKLDFKTGDKNTINYQNFYIQNDFKLVNTTDTITPAICERINNGIKDDNEYLVVFAKPVRLSEKFLLIYNDKLFGVGKQEFTYRNEF